MSAIPPFGASSNNDLLESREINHQLNRWLLTDTYQKDYRASMMTRLIQECLNGCDIFAGAMH